MMVFFELTDEDLERDPSDLYNVSGETFEKTEKLRDCVINYVIENKNYVVLGVRDKNKNRMYSPNDEEIELWNDVFSDNKSLSIEEMNNKLKELEKSDIFS